MVAKSNADYTPLDIATSKGVDGRYFYYISDEIEGRYTQGRYHIVTEVRQQGCGRYTQIGRFTHSRKTHCRLYLKFSTISLKKAVSFEIIHKIIL